MEWEDVRLLPAELLLAVSGIAGLMLAVGAAIEGSTLAPAFGVLALILLAAGGSLAPQRRWSLRLGSAMAGVAIPIWLATLFALDDPTDASSWLFCAGMMVMAGWTSRFLDDELQPPEWMRVHEACDEPPVHFEGGIEELADDSPFPVAPFPIEETPPTQRMPTGA
jgi:hypothetical protein